MNARLAHILLHAPRRFYCALTGAALFTLIMDSALLTACQRLIMDVANLKSVHTKSWAQVLGRNQAQSARRR